MNSYLDLYDALRQNLKSSNSIETLKLKLESCKQGATESVQNFTLRFRQIIINEINNAIQAQYVNPIELTLADRVKMNCYKCVKTGYFANQCHVRERFQPGQNVKKSRQPVRMLQEESTDALQMTPEEIQEQIDYEDSSEFLPYAEDEDLLEQEEEQEAINC